MIKIMRCYLFHIGQLDKASVPIWNKKIQRFPGQDKAGGYGIQDPFGMRVVKGIRGDYYNVVGLPISRVIQVLKCEFGLEL